MAPYVIASGLAQADTVIDAFLKSKLSPPTVVSVLSPLLFTDLPDITGETRDSKKINEKTNNNNKKPNVLQHV